MADIDHCGERLDKGNFSNTNIEGRALFVDTIFTGEKSHANFSETTFRKDAVFRGAVFECFADFSGATFLGEADFTSAVFKKGVSFRGATFGQEYQQDFGNKRLIFFRDSKKKWIDKEKKFEKSDSGIMQYLSILEIGESGAIEQKSVYNILGDVNIEEVIEKYGLEKYAKEVKEAFNTFSLSSAENVSFENCWFCGPDSGSENSDDNEKKIDFSRSRFFNSANVSFDSAVWSNGGDVSFNSAEWRNGGQVSFNLARWRSNVGLVSFESATWSNGGGVTFDSVVWENRGNVWFERADWNNGDHVSFGSAIWKNSGQVWFAGATWSNFSDVSFGSAVWSNAIHVVFNHATWKNGGFVSFNLAVSISGGDNYFEGISFQQKGKLFLEKLLFLNNGQTAIKINKIRDGLEIRFAQCLFMNSGQVDFSGNRFPKGSSVTFHQCYFAGMGYQNVKVNFSDVSWSHAVFEGGRIEWVERILENTGKQKVTLPDVLETRGISYLPDATKDFLGELGGPENITVPHYTTVFDDDCLVSWRGISVDSAKSLTFQLVNLARSGFDGVTLKHIELNAPSWLRKKHSWFSSERNILYSEEEVWKKLLGKEKVKESEKPQLSAKLSNVVNQYDQVRSNLEKYGDYRGAGDFHYGAQHVRRLGRKYLGDVGKTEHFLRSIFFISSGYGERPLRALLMTIIFLAVFTGLSLNFHETGFVKLDSACVEWKDGNNPECKKEGTLFTKAVKTAGHVMSPFWKTTKIEKITDRDAWYYVYLFFANLFIYLQAVMLALAVRRRFKR